MTWLEAAREVVAEKQCKEVDGVLLDLFSASTLVQVHDRLNPENAAKLAAMPLVSAHSLAFKVAQRAQAKAS